MWSSVAYTVTLGASFMNRSACPDGSAHAGPLPRMNATAAAVTRMRIHTLLA